MYTPPGASTPHSLGKLIEWKQVQVIVDLVGCGYLSSPLVGETN